MISKWYIGYNAKEARRLRELGAKDEAHSYEDLYKRMLTIRHYRRKGLFRKGKR